MKLFQRIDDIPSLSAEERLLVESVRTMARDQIAPAAAHYDASGEFPWDNVKAINALGLNGMFIPTAYGGAGLSYAAYLVCVREISKACASTGVIWATNFHAIKPLIDHGTEVIAARPPDEPVRRLGEGREELLVGQDDGSRLHVGRAVRTRTSRPETGESWQSPKAGLFVLRHLTRH